MTEELQGCLRTGLMGVLIFTGATLLFREGCALNRIESKLESLDKSIRIMNNQPRYEIKLTPEQVKELKPYVQIKNPKEDYDKK